jgi:hypothetical protein
MPSTSRVTGSIGNALNSIPGYRGYRAKEDRRDADRRVREKAAAAFAAQADRVERVARDLANQRRIRDVGPVDDFARTIRHLVDRISTASYGYGGLFGDRDVNEAALDQLRLFDESLLTGVEELESPIAQLEQALASGGDLAAPTRTGVDATRTVLARLDLRGEVIETGRPAPQEKIAEIISPTPAETKQPPPAFNLHDGDAVAILGDDYLVDARIDLESGDQALRLFRLNAAPEKWLVVPAERAHSFALVEPTDQSYAGGFPSTIGGEAYTVNWTAAGSGEVIGKGGAMGRRPATITVLTGAADTAARAVVIDWGNERQVLVGKEVHPDDVEIYGAAVRAT